MPWTKEIPTQTHQHQEGMRGVTAGSHLTCSNFLEPVPPVTPARSNDGAAEAQEKISNPSTKVLVSADEGGWAINSSPPHKHLKKEEPVEGDANKTSSP